MISAPQAEVFSLFATEVQEPYAVVVLLEKDLIVVDLTQSKYESPHARASQEPHPIIMCQLVTFGDGTIIITSDHESISLAPSRPCVPPGLHPRGGREARAVNDFVIQMNLVSSSLFWYIS